MVAPNLSRGSIERIIPDHLKMRKVVSRWIAHHLNDEQKQKRLEIYRQNLEKFHNRTWRLCDLAPVMRHGLTTDRLVRHPVIPHGSVKRNYQEPSFVGKELNLNTLLFIL